MLLATTTWATVLIRRAALPGFCQLAAQQPSYASACPATRLCQWQPDKRREQPRLRRRVASGVEVQPWVPELNSRGPLPQAGAEARGPAPARGPRGRPQRGGCRQRPPPAGACIASPPAQHALLPAVIGGAGVGCVCARALCFACPHALPTCVRQGMPWLPSRPWNPSCVCVFDHNGGSLHAFVAHGQHACRYRSMPEVSWV